LISNDSIRDSGLLLSDFWNIWIDLRVGLVNVLSSCIRSLIDNSWGINLLLRNIDLLTSLDFLNITWVTIIITVVSLRANVFSETKEVILSRGFFSWSLDYLSSLLNICLLNLLERNNTLRLDLRLYLALILNLRHLRFVIIPIGIDSLLG
jgi:hypothetical protein